MHRESRYLVIDFVRIVAVGVVVWFHVSAFFNVTFGNTWGYIGNLYQLNAGNIAVSILIILSGQILQLRYGSTTLKWSTFIKKRFTRIYSIYWPTLCICLLIYFFRQKPTPDLTEWVCNLTGTCAFFGRWGGQIDSPSWFIGLILSLYLIFPLLSKLIRNYPKIGLFSMLGISILTRNYFSTTLGQTQFPQINHWHPLTRIFEFYFGMYLATVIPKKWWIHSNRLQLLAELTFPIFLLHYPLEIIFPVVYNAGYTKNDARFAYLLALFSLSFISLKIASYINEILSKKLDLVG